MQTQSHVTDKPQINATGKDALIGAMPSSIYGPAKTFSNLTLSEQLNCAAKLTAVLKLLGNPNRLRILAKLSQKEFSVSQLQATLNRSQSAVSNDLALLKQLNIVGNAKYGKTNYFVLHPQKCTKIKRILTSLLAVEERSAAVRRIPSLPEPEFTAE